MIPKRTRKDPMFPGSPVFSNVKQAKKIIAKEVPLRVFSSTRVFLLWKSSVYPHKHLFTYSVTFGLDQLLGHKYKLKMKISTE